MKGVLSWLIVISIVLIIFNPLMLIWSGSTILIPVAFAIGILSAVILIIILIIERIKDKEVEKDDLNKY